MAAERRARSPPIRLWLGVLQGEWAGDTDLEDVKIDGLHQPASQSRDGVLVRARVRAHRRKESAQQLNAGVLVEAAGLQDPLVLVDREPVQLGEIEIDCHRRDATAASTPSLRFWRPIPRGAARRMRARRRPRAPVGF